MPGGKLRVLCVNGDEHEHPIAEVYLEVRGQSYQMTVGAVEGLRTKHRAQESLLVSLSLTHF